MSILYACSKYIATSMLLIYFIQQTNESAFEKAYDLIGKGRIVELNKLLDERGTPDLKSKYGITLLMVAAKQKNIEIVTELLSRKANVRLEADWTKFTALDYACIHGTSEIVELLLRNGADPNHISSSGSSAIIWAHEDREKIELLIRYKANVNIKNKDGNTVLSHAIANRDYQAVKLLLDNQADPLIRDGQGRNALDLCKITGSKKLISLVKKYLK